MYLDFVLLDPIARHKAFSRLFAKLYTISWFLIVYASSSGINMYGNTPCTCKQHFSPRNYN